MQLRILFESSFEGIRDSMLLRNGRSLTNLAAAVMACVAMFIYAFALPGTHAPSLHAAASAVADSVHSHDHGDHSHDDLDMVADDTGVSDHHHADHTHEKAGLSDAISHGLRNARGADYAAIAKSLLGKPPQGIDRPPRTVNLT
ncbi:hypothetical protein ACQKGC_27865 [Allorhizobium pseudoryzae]|uniref:hypothetical protein n=1 Tax=Allorhizobium pseudoryzae TaxID=379684 RepID=UPI003CFD201B